MPKIKPKLPTVKRLHKLLDALCHQVLRASEPAQCVTCGSRANLGWGHLITQGKKATRWDMLNIHWQCNPCNFRHEHNPEVYTDWFIRHHGVGAYHALVKRSWSREGKPYRKDELLTLYKSLNDLLQSLIKSPPPWKT